MDKTERLALFSVIALAAVVVIAAMHPGEAIVAPLTLALVAGVVLSPLSDYRESRGYSPVRGALVEPTAMLAVGG